MSSDIIYVVSHCEYGDIHKKNLERYIDCFFTNESEAMKYIEEQEKLYPHSFDFTIEKVYKGVVSNE